MLIYFECVLRICTGTGLFSHIIYPILFGLAAGFFFAGITSLFPHKINRIITIVILFLTGLIFTAECLVKRSFQFYMPLGGISSGAGDVAGAYLAEASRAIFHGLPAIVLFFLPGILYAAYGKKYMPARRYKPAGVVKIFAYSVVCMLLAILVANVGNSALKYKKQYKFDTATEYFGLITSLRLDAKYAIFGNDAAHSFIPSESAKSDGETESGTPTADPSGQNSDSQTAGSTVTSPEEINYDQNVMNLPLDEISATTTDEDIRSLNDYVASLTPSSQNKYTGIFKGKNLILICAEAFSDMVIAEQLTPTLYRMAHKGFYFSEYYQPNWGGSTSTGEYSFLIGLVPLHADQSMLEVKNNNLYFTMGNQLRRQGYYSCAYHNGNYDYYSRNLTHENLGYDQYLGLGNGLEDLTGWWPDDKRMFDLTLETYIDKQPFSIYYMTISGHCIYTSDDEKTLENEEYVRSIVGDRYKNTTVYYLCYQLKLEQALTSLIEQLETAGIADDTVICLTADHYPYGLENTATFGNDQDYVSDLYGYTYTNDWEQDHNSWLIWSDSLENEYKDLVCEISKPTYSLDVLPTLSNLGLFHERIEPDVIFNSH